MKKRTNILWGLAFIVIGIILGLNALEITNINLFFDGWWTLFIIVPCFIDLFDGDDLTSSIIGIIIGTSLLLCCQDVITFELIWQLALPVILILIGFSFIFRNSSFDKALLKKDKKDLAVYCATFGEQNIDLSNEKVKDCNLTAVFGEVNYNIEESKITEDIIIYATAIFGGINITVPKNVKVLVKSIPIFGGVSNKRKNPKDDKAVTIYIKGVSLFGGIDIK